MGEFIRIEVKEFAWRRARARERLSCWNIVKHAALRCKHLPYGQSSACCLTGEERKGAPHSLQVWKQRRSWGFWLVVWQVRRGTTDGRHFLAKVCRKSSASVFA